MARKNAQTEQPESTPAEGTAPAENEEPADISAFVAAVETSLKQMDKTNGEISPENTAPVTEQYRNLDGAKGKRVARDYVEEQTKESIKNKDMLRARAFISVRDAMTPGKSPSASTPKDPTEGFLSKLAVLVAAREILESRVPEGVSDDWADKLDGKVEALVAEGVKALDAEDGTEVEVSAEARKVAKLASGRVVGGGGGFSGPRRDIGKHLEQAFADKAKGTFMTIAEIANSKTAEYGDDNPSSGAVSARLFPKSGEPNLPEGITPTPKDGDRSRGATKTA